MNSKLAILTGSLVMALVACSSGDDGSQQGSAPCTSSPTIPAPDGTAADDEPSSSANSGPSAADAGGVKKTPGPIDSCEGAYECPCATNGGKIWLHGDGTQCEFGDDYDNLILHPDGRVTSDSGKQGTWSGDAIYFKVTFPRICSFNGVVSDTVYCTRKQ